MTAVGHRCATALMVFLTCGLVTVLGVGASSAGAAPERNIDAIAGTARGGPSVVSSGGVGLSIPRPTGRHPVGVRSTFVLDPARTEPRTGGPRAIPVRVWYPARHRQGSSAPYFSAAVQAAIEQGVGVPAGLFDIDTHAMLDASACRHVRGVLLFTGGFAVPVALYTGLISELASRGYAVVAFDHPHETFVVEQPDGSLIRATLRTTPAPAGTARAARRHARCSRPGSATSESCSAPSTTSSRGRGCARRSGSSGTPTAARRRPWRSAATRRSGLA
jgi:hypothetical protein